MLSAPKPCEVVPRTDADTGVGEGIALQLESPHFQIG